MVGILDWNQVTLVVKKPPANAGDIERRRFDLWVGKIPWRRAWQPTPFFLSGESPWTEEPEGLQSMGSQSWTQLKWLSRQAYCRWKHKIHFHLDSFQRHKEKHLQEQRAPSNYYCLPFAVSPTVERLQAECPRAGRDSGRGFIHLTIRQTRIC